MGVFQKIKDGLLNLVFDELPKNYSMCEENNILGIYNENFILTKQENLVGMLEIQGASYSALKETGLFEYFDSRQKALDALLSEVVVRIYTTRRKTTFKQNNDISNPYAKMIVARWENKDIYENKYFIVFESVSGNLKGFFEKKKIELTTSIKENTENENITYFTKETKLLQVMERVKQALYDFKPKMLDSKSILRFYAEYINGVNLPIEPIQGFLTDSYIASNVAFKKDYFIQDFNGEQFYNRFIGVKAYETEQVSSIVISTLLHLDIELDVIFSIKTLGTEEAIGFLKDRRKFTSIQAVKAELSQISENISSGRLTLQQFALNVLVKAKTKEELDLKSREILDILNNSGFTSVIETIGMLPTYFSMFPNRINLNHRLRSQISKAIASMILFEQENRGFKANSWGNMPLTIFKNQSQSPYFFNFHAKNVEWSGAKHNIERVNGHTMIIGGTGAGKTTLLSFLMTSILKYENIDILALDRLNGLYAFTEFLDGTYNNGEHFKINPFSLTKNPDNLLFLKSFFESMLGVSENDPSEENAKKINAISKAITSLYDSLTPQGIEFGLKDFKEVLEKTTDLSLSLNLERYLTDPLFASLEDSLNFKTRINTINMDFIVNSQKNAGLLAYYLFHKMIARALSNDRGFFIFIDEFKSYTENEVMNEKINLAITQARKANGVIALALQDINQLKEVKNAESFIANMGTLIIFPQKNIDADTLKTQFKIQISDMEKHFLENTSKGSYQVLIKNMEDGSSNIVDVNLKSLGKFLNAFSSNASAVNHIKQLKEEYPFDWRERFLNG